jgi:hypothetical protein
MVISIVSSATNMMKNGLLGGFLSVQDSAAEFHWHCEDPASMADGASMQEA